MKKIGKGTYRLAAPVYLGAHETVVGGMEKKGPLGAWFKNFSEDEYFGQNSFERAEIFMQKEAMRLVIEKSQISEKNIDFVFAGDLQNQCAGANYSLRGTDLCFCGLYGACSTMAEALILASMAVDGGFARNALALTSSHYCTAERQYRFPLEYGALRPPSSQWTVTAAGCTAVSVSGREDDPVIRHFTPGVVVDMNVKDTNHMGAAMAPAAAATLERYFTDTETVPDDYDLIATGDLGSIGHQLVVDLLSRQALSLDERYVDCGVLIFDPKTQDVHAGGSGCGCSAAVLNGYILPEMQRGRYKNVLFIGTGALMNPTVSLQGETIPAIAHLVHITRG